MYSSGQSVDLPTGTSQPMTASSITDVQIIPGVGPSIAKDLRDLGVHTVDDLRGADPECLYDTLCGLRQAHIDRCVLYVFRCAVYYANTDKHEARLLKWWNWKDRPTISGEPAP